MDINEGAIGDQVLRVELPDDADLGDFEIVEEAKPYREWCVPAALINARATVTLMDDEAYEEEMARRRAHNAARQKSLVAEIRRRDEMRRRRLREHEG